MSVKERILCIGAGYVGGPTMAVIAEKCPHCRVELVDVNEERIRQWNSDDLPIYEAGLDEIVKRNRGKNLFFSTDIGRGIDESDIIFVSVNTPTKTFGQGAGQAADLQYWEKTARQILRHSRNDKIVVEKSTLPVLTAEAMDRILSSGGDDAQFDVLSNPEFLAEGTAIRDLLEPDRVLLGRMDTERGHAACDRLSAIYENWVDRSRILRTNVWSAELSKLVANAFLAQRISSINSISALCEKTKADVTEVARAIGLDSRIGPRFLNAGVGFGGSCFKKDILNLVYICRQQGLNEVADYWQQVVRINVYQHDRFVANMIAEMFNTVAGKKIAVLGFAFKANTGDTRESPAITVCRRLLAENALVHIADPKALRQVEAELGGLDGVSLFEDPYEAAEGAHAIALLTDWACYRELNFQRILDAMEKPAFLFDGRNLLDHRALYKIGFNVYPIGKTPLRHF
ncbi:MAG TPA: nucleotide sugar dehydrogenase [Sumerlaeia bacterium]|nr:nucleotide sugar dehydrogenase [Sumerlaeia bacterium]